MTVVRVLAVVLAMVAAIPAAVAEPRTTAPALPHDDAGDVPDTGDADTDSRDGEAGDDDGDRDVAMLPDDPAAAARRTADTAADVTTGVALGSDTWFELHGYARMPLNLEPTPRAPYLVDNDYYLSGFAYTRLYEPDWSELFFSAHHGTYQVKFGLFASLYSDYASAKLENQLGIAQASVSAKQFLGLAPLSVELGVFWDRLGYIEPYDTYVFGRTHQGGLKARWDFAGGAYVQAGAGIHQRPPQSQGLTAVSHVTAGVPVGPATVAAYLVKAWTRDKPQLQNIDDGDLLVAGADVRVELPRELGHAYVAAAYTKATQAEYLAPALELLHSTGGRGLTENYFGTQDSDHGTGSISVVAADAPIAITERASARVFGMMAWVRSNQVSDEPLMNKDRRLYLKWGAEPGFLVIPHIRASLRYDRVILDVHDADNSFRAVSPKLSFPLASWGELFVMYSRYVYGDKVKLRPGQVPAETEPDTNVFKVQAQAVW